VAEESGIPVLVVAQHDQLGLIAEASGVSDLLVAPPDPDEMKLRLDRLTSRGVSGDTIRWKDLELNTATYQAHLGTQPVDLTYMEYELLRFFVENQGRVWTREQLLAKVWGYDYFGGARTVDVHVRRLRAKLGEERSSWITTVRSVGYRWG
jgi:DNA-binding response OmpR family regulator